MFEVVWPDDTLFQLNQIKAYIALFDPAAAERITARLVILGNGLAAFPNRGRPGIDNTRELATVAPYILSYKVKGSAVIIVDIRHGRRQPLA